MSFRPLFSGLIFLCALLSLLYALSAFGHREEAAHGVVAEVLYPSTSLMPFLREGGSEVPEEAKAVLDQTKLMDNLLSELDREEPEEVQEAASSAGEKDTVILPPLPSPLEVTPIEGTEEGLRQLDPLFRSLMQLQNQQKGSVRILHYGDSQIEGDRITSYLRSRLQRTFGGAGTGLLNPCSPLYPPYGLEIEASENVRLHSMVPATQREENGPYGVMGAYCRITHVLASPEAPHGLPLQASFQLSRKQKVGRSMQFTSCGVFLWNGHAPTVVALRAKDTDSLVSSDTLSMPAAISMMRLAVPKDLHAFTLEIYSEDSPLLFGLSLEGPGGVQVDNIPLRGSSGTDFVYMKDTILRESARILSPRLILLQFGVNVVPTKAENYDYYRGYLRRQIARLKRFYPTASFILIGVSDMAEKVGVNYRTYSNLNAVRTAQRQAALESNIAYWDAFTAMGGENAIVAWANAQPALANRDYVHFTPKGARFFSELFYAALLAQYNGYLEHTKQ